MNTRRQSSLVHLVAAAFAAASFTQFTHAFSSSPTLKNLGTVPLNLNLAASQRSHAFKGRSRVRIEQSSTTVQEDEAKEAEQAALAVLESTQNNNVKQPELIKDKEGKQSAIWQQISDKMGKVDDDRLIFPEYNSGEVPRMFSSLKYNQNEKTGVFTATHAAGSVLGAAALVAGTTVGAGVLALPTATAAAGFLPSSAALVLAWVYMTMSGLLISELTLNRMAETGRPGSGLLDLYESVLGKPWSWVGSTAYFFLHYAVMVAYIAQGGANLNNILSFAGVESLAAIPGAGQAAFAAVCGVSLYAANPSVIQKVNNGLVLGVIATFMGVVAIGSGTADFGALVDLSNQHPEQIANCFPICFLSIVYQNIVPTVVAQLEGDRTKITKAIIAGTSTPLLMFLAWNAVVLGNVVGTDLGGMDPVAMLQSGATGSAMLGPLVSAFSSLALVTSIVGFTHGLLSAWTDVFDINTQSEEFENWKAPLFGLIFLPPLALSVADPDIFYKALDFGGAFGVSTLFLVLPPIMVWRQRYGDDQKQLMTKPMVPFGKLSLGSMWKAAGTLIVEQGADKLGVFDFFRENFLS